MASPIPNFGGVFDPNRPQQFGDSVTVYGDSTVNSPTARNGYSTGAGGAVTQITSKSTAVTLNKPCGTITMHNAALANATAVAFTLNNTVIAATDVVNVSIKSGATTLTYLVGVQATAAGSCSIVVFNYSGSSQSEALVLNFAVVKSVAA